MERVDTGVHDADRDLLASGRLVRAVERRTDHRHVPLEALERFGTGTTTLRRACCGCSVLDDGEPLGCTNLAHPLTRGADRHVLDRPGDTRVGLDRGGEAGIGRYERQADRSEHVDEDATGVGDRLQRLLLVRGVEGDDVLAAGVVLLLGCRGGLVAGVGARHWDQSRGRNECGGGHQPVMSHTYSFCIGIHVELLARARALYSTEPGRRNNRSVGT
jgi:hypothetical protein